MPPNFFNKPFEFLLYKLKQIDYIFPRVCVYCNRWQKTSQGAKNNSHASRLRLVSYFIFFTHCDVICDLLQYTRTENVIYLLNSIIRNEEKKQNKIYMTVINSCKLDFIIVVIYIKFLIIIIIIIPRQVKKRLEVIGIETRVKELQKTVIIHSARIFRKVLEIWGVLLTPNHRNILPLLISEILSK